MVAYDISGNQSDCVRRNNTDIKWEWLVLEDMTRRITWLKFYGKTFLSGSTLDTEEAGSKYRCEGKKQTPRNNCDSWDSFQHRARSKDHPGPPSSIWISYKRELQYPFTFKSNSF
jgi:hypothetical protein